MRSALLRALVLAAWCGSCGGQAGSDPTGGGRAALGGAAPQAGQGTATGGAGDRGGEDAGGSPTTPATSGGQDIGGLGGAPGSGGSAAGDGGTGTVAGSGGTAAGGATTDGGTSGDTGGVITGGTSGDTGGVITGGTSGGSPSGGAGAEPGTTGGVGGNAGSPQGGAGGAQCPALPCAEPCPFGYGEDDAGCATCVCADPPLVMTTLGVDHPPEQITFEASSSWLPDSGRVLLWLRWQFDDPEDEEAQHFVTMTVETTDNTLLALQGPYTFPLPSTQPSIEITASRGSYFFAEAFPLTVLDGYLTIYPTPSMSPVGAIYVELEEQSGAPVVVGAPFDPTPE